MIRLYRDALPNIRRLPGVRSAGMITHLPFGDNDWGNSFEVEGRPAPAGADYVAQIHPISPDYMATMGVPLN